MERYNPWWSNDSDPKYIEWEESAVHWKPDIIKKIDLTPFALHFISGPRQVGKTTALKILAHRLVEERDPFSVLFYPCNELLDHRELGAVLDTYLSAREERGVRGSVIMLDEITFVHEWWRAVKDRIDRGAVRE